MNITKLSTFLQQVHRRPNISSPSTELIKWEDQICVVPDCTMIAFRDHSQAAVIWFLPCAVSRWKPSSITQNVWFWLLGWVNSPEY